MKPFLMWAGGKTWLLPEILKRLPREIPYYHEPFLGGGAVFFALKSEGRLTKTAYLSDTNQELIDTYRALRDDPGYLLGELTFCAGQHSESFYYSVRDYNEAAFGLSPAARFLYLNKACFNGLYRVNKSGKFNVSWGKQEKIRFDFENLKACSEALQDVYLQCESFRIEKDPNWVTYCDPPYYGTFDAYGPGGFSDLDHAALYEQAQRAGGLVLVSNSAEAQNIGIYFGADLLDTRHRMRHTKAVELLWSNRCWVERLKEAREKDDD